MKLKFVASGLAIVLGMAGVGTIGFPEGAIAQTQTNEIDRAIAEGMRLFKEGSAESLRKAIGYFQKVLELARSANDQYKQALSLLTLGKLHDSLGEKQKAIEYFNQSLPIWDAVGNQSFKATTLNNLGQVYDSLGKKQKAIEYLNQSLVIWIALGDRKGEAGALNNLGKVYDDLGERQKALEYFNQSLLIKRVVNDRAGEAATLSNLGSFYFLLGEKQKALEYFNQSLPILRVISYRKDEASVLNNLGEVYRSLGNQKKAIEYFNQSLPVSREVSDRAGEATTLNNLGLVYNSLGEKQKAIEYFNQSLPILRAVGNRSGEAGILNNFGRLYHDLGENQKAIDYYNQSLSISRAVGYREAEASTLRNLGDILHAQKQPELAIVFLKQSVSQYEILRQNIRTLPKETQETYTKTVESAYRKLANLLLKADRILEAQQILDLLKVQELNAYLKNVRSGTQDLYILAPETEILKKHGELQTTAIALGQNLAKLRQIPEQTRTQPQNQEIDRLVQIQIELNQQFNQFLDRPDIQKLITSLSPKTIRQTVDTTQLDALRSKLKTLNAVLIYPLILDDRLELIITTADSPPLRRTVNIKREDLNTTITEFRRALQDPSQDPKPIAQKLYNWLIKPLEADLKASNPKTLIYAPDAQLRYIPIAALHDGTQWLTERYAINHITAQSLTDLTAQPSTTPKILAGAIGNNPTSITIENQTLNFSGLAYTTKEIDSIQSLQPTTRLLNGNDFRLTNLRSKLGDYNILHLATHAALLPKKPESSFILFGTDSYATLRDIESWTLNNFDLVVLSACETGLGGNFGTGGEEILGLGYQFQTRGAKATIASLWQVDDGGTQILMTAFYSALKQGHSKTQALKLAQTALIKNNFQLVGLNRAGAARHITKAELFARSNHPAYWAPFILIGNGL